jgi:hypothetical protein
VDQAWYAPFGSEGELYHHDMLRRQQQQAAAAAAEQARRWALLSEDEREEVLRSREQARLAAEANRARDAAAHAMVRAEQQRIVAKQERVHAASVVAHEGTSAAQIRARQSELRAQISNVPSLERAGRGSVIALLFTSLAVWVILGLVYAGVTGQSPDPAKGLLFVTAVIVVFVTRLVYAARREMRIARRQRWESELLESAKRLGCGDADCQRCYGVARL